MVIWVIGISASGKTTIGKLVYDKLLKTKQPWVFLDGDSFRSIMGEDLGHTIEDRRKNAYRMSNLCKFLESQGINVLACVLSLFHDNQKYNRENFIDYREIFIQVTLETAIKRDNKNLYAKAAAGEIHNVVGVDIEFKPPYAPDVVIDNNEDSVDFLHVVDDIVKKLNISVINSYKYTDHNLLLEPEKYEYTRYEGETFIYAYREARRAVLSRMNKKLDILCRNNILSPALISEIMEKGAVAKEDHGTDYYSTIRLLAELIQKCKSSGLDKNEMNIVLTLIRRFEVSKKIYSRYSKNEVRKISDTFNDTINYFIFSLLLSGLYWRIELIDTKLILFNAILKLNDTISSIENDLVLPSEFVLAKQALEEEDKVFTDFLKRIEI